MIDTFGHKISESYTRVLVDPFFERRLKLFDPNLCLMFHRFRERWMVLEKSPAGVGYNIIIVAEHPDTKHPRPLGDWVFEKLYKYRQMHDLKMKRGVNNWFKDLESQAFSQKNEIEQKISSDHQDMIKDDLLQWKKISKEYQNLPVSDAKAGYPKG